MRILLVEDDPMIGSVVRDSLKDATFAVDWVTDGQAALAAADCQHYDLVLLDLGLPGKDGHAVLQSLRSRGHQVPIIIVTARDTLPERLKGLDAGADDYVLKPFEMAELLARIRAVMRRQAGQALPVMSNGIVTLDPGTRQAHTSDVAPVQLSNREFALLQALLTRPGAILSRSDLEDRIYGWGDEVESNAIEFLIHSLRKKLGSSIIKNVRGAGWMVLKGD
ncbi:response regulator transcription factor [Pandoraea sp. XJJ-1]|uniref:DNA-binding response regulator n=2 Tax=Pandoraea TaxID=93217 RepID=A0A5E4WAM0_9BURK|nr:MULTISPECIES: response regulator transcription factor [Pandoraea]MBN9115057.1 response regulator transcription factor [Pandoraea sp.]MDN4576219.1 DNA-binding response regulator [Pandoraea cepalis]MDN4578851.1 DNA-binding response regulator [Pandoraea cepalis]OJY16543.1 MAG: DNA-binding response regulator [Pandoraea sp. 64-18]WAL82959.1 response regulator transcription factor [Pandoraea sp. XJJ-1]